MRAAVEQGLVDNDVRCVLAVAVTPAISPTTDGERTAWVSWVGDVSAWVLSEGRWSQAAGDRKAGRDDAVYNAVRHTLPGRAAEVQTRLVLLRAGDVLVLTTDGIGDGLATLPPLREHLAQRWRLPCSMTSFLNDVNYDAERFPEDRTAVALWTSVV